MLFSNMRTYQSTSPYQTQKPSSNSSDSFSLVLPIRAFANSYQQAKKAQQEHLNKNLMEISNIPIAEPKKKPMKWGEPTWFLFHTLAEKVKEDMFAQIRVDLLNIIYTICNNLPCPDCANHATEYLNKINFKSIRTKEQLKNLLYVFHNEVNARKGYPLFPRSELDEKYSKSITVRIVQNFMVHFEDKYTSIRMIARDMYRNRISIQLKQWFNSNIHLFSP
jgi:hypothetical protein